MFVMQTTHAPTDAKQDGPRRLQRRAEKTNNEEIAASMADDLGLMGLEESKSVCARACLYRKLAIKTLSILARWQH